MSMTPEERFNQQVWEILQDIKEESFAPEKDGTFFYDTTIAVVGGNSPTRERKWAIIRKLAREKTIEIVREVLPDWRAERNGFYLKLLQPKFDEEYERYRKTCDLTSYLNDYQEKMVKGYDPSDFLHLKSTDDKAATQTPAREKHKGQMFETGSGGGYYNRSHPINPIKKQSANEIVNGFSSSNYAFVLMVVKGILSASEFGTDGEVNYRLQSAPGQMLMQERQLLSKFEKLGLFRNLGEDGIFGIATLSDINTELMKQVIAEMEMKASGVISQEEFEEIKAKNKYEKLIKEIREPSQPSLEERYNKALNEIKSYPKSSITPQRQDVQEQNRPLEAERQTKSPIAPPSKRELRKKLNAIIKIRNLGNKEKAFLKFLAKDFEPKTIEEISKEVATKACTKLKASVQKKLKGTGFNIKTDKGGWGRKATYQLEYLLSSENS